MRPRNAKRVNRVLIAASIAALTLTGTGTASADGVLTDAEAAYVITYGPTAICPVIAKYPSVGGVMGVAQGILEEGWAPDDAVDIINSSVAEYCPRFWPLLTAIGNAARNDQQAGYLI
ncbi:MAG: hypothetical protein K0U84_18525 [Actinomycetia bacterium]|nr:hypothetical protein [Actinomycetes bacterium]